MAISLQADNLNQRGYILIDGQTALTIDLSGITFQNASFSLSNNYSIISTSITIPKNGKTAVNTTSAPLTCTLPSNPDPGDWVQIADAGGNWDTNSLTLTSSGPPINSTSSDFICDVSNQEFTLIYINSTIGWQVNA